MGNVVRIGDNVSCGDHSAKGSSDVFANGIGITHQGANKTTGHPPKYAPTVFLGPWTTSVFVNNQPVAIKGKTEIVPHDKKSQHIKAKASTGSSDVSFEE